MRRLLVALGVAALTLGAAGGSGPVASASEVAVGFAVLTPVELGLTEPAQGFYPFFTAGTTTTRGIGQGIGLGGLAPTNLGSAAFFNGAGGCGAFSALICPFFGAQQFSNTFLSQGALGLASPLLTSGLGFPFTGTGATTGFPTGLAGLGTAGFSPFGFSPFFGAGLGGLGGTPHFGPGFIVIH